MGLFGMFKKKEEAGTDDLFKDTPSVMQQGARQGMPAADPLADINSGLSLGSLNTPQNIQFDSFGNPKRERNYESEFSPSAHMPSQSGDISKDIQIIIAKLDAIKAEPKLKDMALLKISRLSTGPVTASEWKVICKMGGL